ncbi:unnamed protein product, partial [Thelazia callipaeda]|uniref:Uncharacterized protein n=1 Tax=Thelazia callipaeda TaxID=103827 RepID=A0A0N5CT99_THECL
MIKKCMRLTISALVVRRELAVEVMRFGRERRRQLLHIIYSLILLSLA